MLQTTRIDPDKEMFEHIECEGNPSDSHPRDTDGIHLFNLLKGGIDEYKNTSKQTFKFLNTDRKAYDVGSDLAKYVWQKDGKTTARLFDSDFHEHQYDIAVIFDFDAGKVETLKKQPR